MRIHTDLTTADVLRIVRDVPAAVTAETTAHGTRSGKARGIELKLSGTSNRRRNDDSGEDAATWDEWGIVLNALYDADPTMIVKGVYDDAADFHYKTGTRYADLTGADQHRQHKWVYLAPRTFGCTGCDAERRA